MANSKITDAVIRMYRMGTGDCFIIKFLAGETAKFTMMIDCGTWSGGNDHLAPYVENLKEFVDNHIDLLVITHEHKDHVHVFEACKELFVEDFTVDRVWMGWTEADKTKEVKKWQKEYGEKKKALSLAASKLNSMVNDQGFRTALQLENDGGKILTARENFSAVVSAFDELQNNSVGGVYKGGLEGMKIVKEIIGKDKIEFYGPGDIIDDIPELKNISFYVLGPPLLIDDVKKESGGKGESYDHNKELSGTDAFAAAVLASSPQEKQRISPFDDSYVSTGGISNSYEAYSKQENQWRKIDCDWLFSAGSLALRMNGLTNNLSLALAIEFNDSGRVMLFPGDAEYGSWASWHSIDWTVPSRNEKLHFTEDLLRRTVFYKVAHHLSHNGTAERLGMEMMTHPDLASMATLDYEVIAPAWKNTMPNRSLIKALVQQSKGRLMIMQTDKLYYDVDDTVLLKDKIERERKKMSKKEATLFQESYQEEDLFLQFTVKGE